MHGLPNTKPSGLNNSTLLNGTVAPSIPINPWASIKGKEWQAMIQKSFAKEEFHEKMAKIMNGQVKNLSECLPFLTESLREIDILDDNNNNN
jgi:hypothetical protein